MIKNLYILRTGMEHFNNPLITHQLSQRREVLDNNGIDDHALFGRRGLHQSQTCMVCSLTQELGIDGHGIKGRGALAKGQELLICGDVHAPPESWLAHSCAG